MRGVLVGLVVLALLTTAVGCVDAKTVQFRLDPSDPHWVKKVDPNGWLKDLGYAWKATSVGKGTRPEIWFKLPEVSTSSGTLRFKWSKDIPGSYGWDSLELYASKDGATWTKIWQSPYWGYVGPVEVTAVVPAGYTQLKFKLVDGDLDFETITLYKDMSVTIEGATPTPTPSPSPTMPKPTPGFEAVFALAGLIALAYLLGRRCS